MSPVTDIDVRGREYVVTPPKLHRVPLDAIQKHRTYDLRRALPPENVGRRLLSSSKWEEKPVSVPAVMSWGRA